MNYSSFEIPPSGLWCSNTCKLLMGLEKLTFDKMMAMLCKQLDSRGGLFSKSEAKVSPSVTLASRKLSNFPSASITRRRHANY